MGNAATRRNAAIQRQGQIRARTLRTWQQGKGTPKFIADVMLGRLAKWLRIAGFDVLYSNRFSDDELIVLSRREGRVLLSRDTRLLVRESVREFIFLESQDIHEQIRQIFEVTHTTHLSRLLTRCLECNEPLMETRREEVRDSVPEYVFATQMHFKSCLKCKKIFWAGTHRNSVIGILESLLVKE